ncbi:hypothetical protein GobsT_63350 [Gemmata obscuriglobus]|uniref:Uncharacterized protein n=1 Tax=Gemmata obscuriglobus TaxID=114 RepID=A0A2Z3GTR3_9BACT|nr:hypothetical protein [Gemmata obscuriglobus]AWM35931.1 hypothetical protein C1280_02150 [Gemmata obscuriglobus]QEG31513.1 hypothetical protein GobsT_63350 [Gemmata obscuriglobus]VTS10855.1 unnamed protein product [Gemmata obscuriglobus UQM 2246]
MESIARVVAEFTLWTEGHPHLLDLTTREVLVRLRGWLDERYPGWREAALAAMGDERHGVEVEVLFAERTMKGAILQRASVTGSSPAS